MNFVEPIRDIEIIQKIASNLKKQNERDYMMFCFGILYRIKNIRHP